MAVSCRLVLVLIFFVSILLKFVASTGGSGEQQCTIDVGKEERMNRVRANILNQLGLSEAPPNPKVPVFVSEEKIAEFDALQNTMGIFPKKDDGPCTIPTTFAREKRAFSPLKAEAIRTSRHNFEYELEGYGKRDASTLRFYNGFPPTTYKLSFDLDLSNERMFSSADLILYKKIANPQPRLQLTEFETVQVLLVYKKYYYYFNHLVADEKREIIDTRILSTNNEEFVQFNITGAVKKWLKVNQVVKGQINLEVVVRCPELLYSYKKLPPLVEFEVGQYYMNNTAKLVISLLKPQEIVDISNGRRTKRQQLLLDSDFCFKDPNQPNCCVRELKLDFAKDFGWDWVMSPKVYYPNYCSGLCPSLWPTLTASARIFQQFNTVNPTAAVEPCCAPDSLKPIILMFTFGDELFLQLMNNMEVDSCICR